MDTNIILHNMIFENERSTYGGNFDFSNNHLGIGTTTLLNDSDFQEFQCRRFDVCDKQIHWRLQQNIIEHM